MVPKKITDILRSGKVLRAEEIIRGDDVPPVVGEALQVLKSEIVSMRMQKSIAAATPPKEEKDGPHAGVVGLSVGSAKELIDYLLALAADNDRIAQDMLAMSAVDGAITAVIATIATWFSRPPKNKKGRKK